MAKLPIEIVLLSNRYTADINIAIKKANELQLEFNFQLLDLDIANKFSLLRNHSVSKVDMLAKNIRKKKADIKGYYPYLIFIQDARLEDDKYPNLYAYTVPERDITILSSYGVENNILPKEKMSAFFLYFLSKISLSIVAPTKKNHEDTRSCVYDFKNSKKDILLSMKDHPFCDSCKQELIDSSISENQYLALEKLFAECGKILSTTIDIVKISSKPKIFIGSSTEGLEAARNVKFNLQDIAEVEIWNEGTFKLGYSFLECLENALENFDFAIFIFTADDSIEIRGQEHKITRDNVIFEFGMFVGHKTRKKAFIMQTKDTDLHILTDLKGIVTCSFDSKVHNLQAELGNPCQLIRNSIKDIYPMVNVN